MYIEDDIVDILLMANRGDSRRQMEILESPQLLGCGLRISRSYPDTRPSDLEGKSNEEAHAEIERRMLLEAITVWNTRKG
jgi:hypothetical protein